MTALNNIFKNIEKFITVNNKINKTCENIFIRTLDDGMEYIASSSNNSVQINMYSNNKVDDFNICMGQISFLKNLLTSDLINAECSLEYKDNNVDKKIIKSISFKDKKYSIVYRATDPTSNNVIKPKLINSIDFDYTFTANQSFISDLSNLKKMVGLSNGKTESIELVCADKLEIIAGNFGTLIEYKPEDTIIEKNTNSKIVTKLDIDLFSQIISMLPENNRISVSQMLVNIVFSIEDNMYSVNIFCKKD